MSPSGVVLTCCLAITNVNVFDSASGAWREDMSLLIDGDVIVDVGKDITLQGRVIDGNGQFLIPGLWDMHVHLSKARANALPLFVAHGVTTVRDMGSELQEVRRWERDVALEERVGPRIFTAGPYLESLQSVESMRRRDVVEPIERTRIAVESPEHARSVVAHLAESEVDFLKIRNFTSLETYMAIGSAARETGLTLTGHAFGLTPEQILDAGHRSIEHGLYPTLSQLEEARRERVLHRFRESGTVVVSTSVTGALHRLSIEEAERIFEDDEGEIVAPRRYVSLDLLADWREQVAEVAEEHDEESLRERAQVLELIRRDFVTLHRAGIPVLPGTDLAVAFVYPGYSLHEELANFVDRLGMTPGQALRAATYQSAQFMDRDDLGVIRPGAKADLVLLRENPLVNIRNTRSIAGVVLRGRHFSADGLARLRESVLDAPELKERQWTRPVAQDAEPRD